MYITKQPLKSYPLCILPYCVYFFPSRKHQITNKNLCIFIALQHDVMLFYGKNYKIFFFFFFLLPVHVKCIMHSNIANDRQ